MVRDEQQADRYRDKLHTILDERFLQSTRILCDLDTSLDAPRAAITGIKTALSEATQDAIIAVPVDFVGVRSAHLNSLIKDLTRLSQLALALNHNLRLVCCLSLAFGDAQPYRP